MPPSLGKIIPPSERQSATPDLLDFLASLAPSENEETDAGQTPPPLPLRPSAPSSLGPLDVGKYLDHYGYAYTVKDQGGKKIFRLERCLFDSDHKKNEAAIIQDAKGLITYQCFHDSCKKNPGRQWQGARKIISGDAPLAPFCDGYDPHWKPKAKRRQGAGKAQEDTSTEGGNNTEFLYINEKGRASFNPAIMSHFLVEKYAPVLNEGEEWGSLFYRYTEEGLWRLLTKAELKRFVHETLGIFSTPAWVDNALKEFEFECTVLENERRASPMWLNLKNCMLNVRTMKTAPHDPKYYSMSQLPVKYDPETRAPIWVDEFLPAVFADDLEKIMVLQEFFGYCLFPRIIFPAALFQIGGGANGKGTVQRILEAMLGDENVSHISLKRMEDRFGIVEIKDKLLNTCGETSTQPLEVTRFKEVAAADRIQAERKYLPDISFIPIAKHMISMNEFPGIKDKTDAFFRRIIVLEYMQKFEGENDDTGMSEKLLKELDGIFMWALRGLQRVMERGYIFIPEVCMTAKKRLRAKVNHIITFVDEECLVGSEYSCHPPDMYQRYVKWAEASKLQPYGRSNFYEQIQLNFNVQRVRLGSDTTMSFKGITMTTESQF